MAAIPSDLTRFRNTGYALIGALVLTPLSTMTLIGLPIGDLTLGRATILWLAVALVRDLRKGEMDELQRDRAGTLLAAAYLGLGLWILINSQAWGCNCDGKVIGYGDFAAIGLLALAAMSFEPRLRGPALWATFAGVLFGAVLALVGAAFSQLGLLNTAEVGGRLSGTFGNPNELGYSIAFGIPIAVAYRTAGSQRVRLGLAAASLSLIVALLLSYSRAGLIAASAGALAVLLWESRGARRRSVRIALAASAAAALAIALYPVFQSARKDVSYAAPPPGSEALDARDLSGWDGRSIGPIPRGPSELLNRDSAIAVRSKRAGEGVSFGWGEAQAGDGYTLRFRARSSSVSLPFNYGLGDRIRETGGVEAAGTLGRRWSEFSLAWRPTQRSPHATLHVWQTAGPSNFALTDVSVSSEPIDGGAGQVINMPRRLKGSAYDRVNASADPVKSEERYISSRWDAAELALRAFAAEPLRGIGWGKFPTYAAKRLEYGALAVHNQYLAVAAELGIVGVALLALLIAAVLYGAVALRPGRESAAVVGMLLAGAAGLLFVEGLSSSQGSIPLAIAAALACTSRRVRDT